MGRGRIFGMILVGLILWTGPVFGASIQKFKDPQGVIRITNVKPRSRTAYTPEVTAPSPASPEKPPALAAAAPPTEKVISPQPGAPIPAPDSGDSHVSSPPVSNSRNETSPRDPVNLEIPLPIKKAAFSGPELPAPMPAAAKTACKIVSVTPGSIRRYRDVQGVWHIENVTSGPPALSPSNVEAPALEASGPREDGLPEMVAAKNQPPEEGAIRRYRDRQAVLHITNLAGPPEHPHQLARAWDSRDGPVLKPPPTPALADPPLVITRASWEAEAPPAERRSPQFLALPAQSGTPPGQIKSYRDARGVLHIHSVEPALPPPPPEPLAWPRGLLSLAFASPPFPKARGWPNPPALVLPGGQVVAYKDKQGRLIIRNPDPQTLASRGPPSQPSPYLQAIILEAAQTYGLPPPLIEAVIKVESNSVPWAVSPKGAMGLMQLMPGTAEFLGVQNPFCPRENVLGGSRYLRLLLNLFQESLPLALAAYNAGFQRVINCGYQVPEIKETQDFVTQVMGRFYLAAKRANQPGL